MNKVILIGNVTKDVELNTTNGGTNYVNFSMAVSRGVVDNDGEPITDFFNCVAYNKLAENISKYVNKGNKLFVCGKLVIDTYTDNQGVKKNVPKIMVNEVEFLTPKSKVESAEDNPHPGELEPIKMDDDSLPF